MGLFSSLKKPTLMFFFFWVIVNVVNFESFDFTLGREGVDFGTLKNASFMILLGLLPSVYFLFLNVGRSMTYFSNLMLKFNDLSREISPSVLSCSVSFGTSPSPSFFFFSFFFGRPLPLLSLAFLSGFSSAFFICFHSCLF